MTSFRHPRPTARRLLRALRPLSLAIGFGVALPGAALHALEANLSAPKAPEELTDKLEGASAALILGDGAELQEIIAAALSDYRTLVQVLYDAGYFAPVVNIRLDGREAAAINLLNPPRSVDKIDISVDPGPSFTFGRAVVRPLPANEPANLPADFASGRPASTGVIQQAATAGLGAWDRAGHAKAELSNQSITADAVKQRLDADLQIAPGPRLQLGNLRITGQSDVRREAIQRIAGFATGQTYHPDLVSKSATRLRRTGAFSTVTVKQAETPNPDGTLDFIAEVEDQPKRRFTFGVEVSSSEAVKLSSSWMHRNLFGAAERLKIDLSVSGLGTSELDGSVSARLDRPAALGTDRTLFYLAALEQLQEEHYTARSATAAIGVRRIVSDTTFVEGALGLRYVKADDAFGDNREFKYFAGRLRGEKDKRNVKTDPSAGYYLDGEIVPFVGLGGGDPGVQINIDARGYKSLGSSGRIVLAGRVQLGSLIGPDQNNVSPTLLYFSGGAGSVRGQEFQSLGIDVGGKTAGGRGYLALSGEVRGRITDTISLVGFYDAGFVDQDSFVSGDSEFHAGAGLGLRYNVTGIGPIRLDLAMPVSGDTEDGLQFYIGIGQAF
ncbi:autotransporter assembly complex protein TamA [Tritonibacter scottomollicae]|uniref:Autotransporter secretion outer membrane protein TamA n=1 Tax=Tritonibacter scottomollicae TaxID=483013 RepID=A0A2T1ANX2_TRISK|nr:BamA/TamA family outer membrane protein [Tritonibacter scottomollicae]PRZ50274.1 autotransporter secretion outer membrane protein TamA [Tritonibacter scottomollicae]